MRPEQRPRAAPEPDLDAEGEIDVGRYWWALVHRWWVVVAAIVVGAVIGYLVSLGGGTTYQAKATVYLGQPLSPGGAQLQSVQTNPAAVTQFVRSDAVIRRVAANVGIPPDRLRAGIAVAAVAGATSKNGQTPLVQITVRGPWRRQSAQAANQLAKVTVDHVSTYVDAQISQLTKSLQLQGQALQRVEAQVDRYQKALNQSSKLDTTDKLILLGLLDNATQARSGLLNQQTQTQLQIALARDVQHGDTVTPAIANKVAATGHRSSIVVGAVIGLVVGLLLALLWDPVARRVQLARQAG